MKKIIIMLLAIMVGLFFFACGPKPPADPVIEPEAGTHLQGTPITMTCETEGATIFYTTDGTDPGTEPGASTQEYDDANKPTIDGTEGDTITVKALSYIAEDDVSSNIVTVEYTVGAPSVELTITIEGDGTVEVTDDGDTLTGTGPWVIESGSEVVLTATGNSPYEFFEWTGDITSSENPYTIASMDADYSITAHFAEPVTLTVNQPADGGEIRVDGFGGDPAPATSEYPSGGTATIYGTPMPGYELTEWTDDGAGVTDNPIELTMDGAKTLSATFTERTGAQYDDFEDGFEPTWWHSVLQGDAAPVPGTITTDYHLNGAQAAEFRASIDDYDDARSYKVIDIENTGTADSYVSFWYKVSCYEDTSGYTAKFMSWHGDATVTDDYIVETGEKDWQYHEYTIPAGETTFIMVGFFNWATQSAGESAAWVDDFTVGPDITVIQPMPDLEVSYGGEVMPDDGSNFGNVGLIEEGTTATLQFSVDNVGLGPLEVTGVTVGGDFTLSGTAPTGTVEGGFSVTFDAEISGTTAGNDYTADITVSTAEFADYSFSVDVTAVAVVFTDDYEGSEETDYYAYYYASANYPSGTSTISNPSIATGEGVGGGDAWYLADDGVASIAGCIFVMDITVGPVGAAINMDYKFNDLGDYMGLFDNSTSAFSSGISKEFMPTDDWTQWSYNLDEGFHEIMVKLYAYDGSDAYIDNLKVLGDATVHMTTVPIMEVTYSDPLLGDVLVEDDSTVNDFGFIGDGQSQNFTITNHGRVDLNLTGTPDLVAVSGDATLTTDATTPITANGGTSPFTVTPTAGLSAKNIVVSIDNDSNMNPYNFEYQVEAETPTPRSRLYYTDVDPEVVIPDDDIQYYDLGTLPNYADIEFNFRMENYGTGDLTIDNPRFASSEFDFTEGSDAFDTGNIPSYGAETFSVKLLANGLSAGTYTTVITINTANDQNPPFEFGLTVDITSLDPITLPESFEGTGFDNLDTGNTFVVDDPSNGLSFNTVEFYDGLQSLKFFGDQGGDDELATVLFKMDAVSGQSLTFQYKRISGSGASGYSTIDVYDEASGTTIGDTIEGGTDDDWVTWTSDPFTTTGTVTIRIEFDQHSSIADMEVYVDLLDQQ